MLKIERHLPEHACYFCKRTIEDLRELIKPNEIQKQVEKYLNRGLEQRDTLIKKFRKYLMGLLQETQDYPASLTVEEMEPKLKEHSAMMPRLEELLKYRKLGQSSSKGFLSRKTEYNLETIQEIRVKIKEVYEKLIVGKVPKEIKIIDENLYYKMKKVAINPNLEKSKFVLPTQLKFYRLPLVLYTDLNGVHVRKAVDRKYYYDYNFDRDRLLSDADPVDKANIVEITIHVSVCSLCSHTREIFRSKAI